MGQVVLARDELLDRKVALKFLTGPGEQQPSVRQRFVREAKAAAQLDHPFICKVYEAGEVDDHPFIAMEYVEGDTLAERIRSGPMDAEEVSQIALDIAEALEVAHDHGIIHRDLKPSNVMLTAHHAKVMDFGLAKFVLPEGEGDSEAITLSHEQLTGQGAAVGTLLYMSPEQAQGHAVDVRSDVFSFGILLHEMLTGEHPFRRNSTLETVSAILRDAAPAVRSGTDRPPPALEAILHRALAKSPGDRYASGERLAEDLRELHRPDTHSGRRRAWTSPRRLGGLAGLVAALALGGWWLTSSRQAATPTDKAPDPVSVLVADFGNATGEEVFDGVLEPMFNVALEGASFVNTFNRRQARALASKLPNPTDKLDEQAVRLIAVSEGIDVVLTGSVSRGGDGYRVCVQALDGRTGRSVAAPEATAKTKDEVLRVIPTMVAPIRKALGDTTPEAAQLRAVSGAFTATSLEAVRLDAEGVELQFAGKIEEAFQSFKKAAEIDPRLPRAYSGMAAMAQNLGRTQEAAQYLNLAMEHVDRMTERERYRFRGQYYMNKGDWQKCVDEYAQLMERYPVDRVGQNNLASCLASARRAPEAVEAARRAVELVPKGAGQRFNLAFISLFAGDFDAGEREARVTMKLAPSLGLAFLPLAEAQLGQGQLQQAAGSYRELEKSNPSVAAVGLADLAAYEGRYRDAVRILEDGIAADESAKAPENAAGKWAALAEVQLVRGQNRAAVDAARKALAKSHSVNVRFLAARTLVQAGEAAPARATAAEFDSKLTAEPQAYGRIIAGMSAAAAGDTGQAIKALTEANRLLDTWIGRFELGRAYLSAGEFVQADAEFERCIKRRGEALELFLDNAPTYRFLPAAYYYGGRAREGLKSEGYARFYRTYLGIRGQAGEDPLLPDIRRRLGQ